MQFEPGRVPGLLGMSGIEIELGHVLSRKVDLRTAADLLLPTLQAALAGT